MEFRDRRCVMFLVVINFFTCFTGFSLDELCHYVTKDAYHDKICKKAKVGSVVFDKKIT